MDNTEKQVIDELFGKIRQAEGGSGPRDPGAEARIREHILQQPAAPYYMAQAIIIQEQALGVSQARIEQLKRELAERPAGGGGFLGGLFGGGSARSLPAQPSPGAGWDPRVAGYADPRRRQGGGFLAGAMQTAVGVAGGVLLGSALAGMFADPAAAAEPFGDAAADAVPEEMDLGGFDEEF